MRDLKRLRQTHWLMCITAEKTCIKQAAVWKVPESGESSEEIPALQQLCRLDTDGYGEDVKCTFFHPNEGGQLLTIVDSHYLIWNLELGSSLCQVCYTP
jgi:hypothetical protein